MNDFDRYIKNLDSEHRTMRFYKLAYLYICAFVSSWLTWERQPCQARLQPWLAIYCIHWSIYYQKGVFSVIKTHDKYSRLFLVGLTLAYKASSQVQYILLRFLHKLERVATSGDPQGIWYKSKLRTLYRSEAAYALICSGK